MLVENKALSGDKLYLLKFKIGAWGQVEYFASEAPAVLGEKDDRRTVAVSGLNYSDVLIVSWNKPISDGQPVLPASYE